MNYVDSLDNNVSASMLNQCVCIGRSEDTLKSNERSDSFDFTDQEVVKVSNGMLSNQGPRYFLLEKKILLMLLTLANNRAHIVVLLYRDNMRLR